MAEKYYSYREFAKIAGISPQKVSSLIQKGDLHTNEAGLVPASEVQYIIREKILKNLDNNKNALLYITVNKTDEELDDLRKEIKEGLEKLGNNAVEYSSIQAVVNTIMHNMTQPNKRQEDVVEAYNEYRKNILKELVKRTKEAAFRCIKRYVMGDDVGNLRLRSLYEMLMYDRIYSDTGEDEEEYRRVLTSALTPNGVRLSPIELMESSFQSIVVSLNLIDGHRVPLIKRSSLSPEIVEAIEEMSSDASMPNNEAVKALVSLNIVPSNKMNKRAEGSESAKVFQTVSRKSVVKNMTEEVISICNKGFYVLLNITEGFTDEEVDTLIDDIQDGYYKVVELDFPNNVMPDGFPEVLRRTLLRCNQKKKVIVRTRKASK